MVLFIISIVACGRFFFPSREQHWHVEFQNQTNPNHLPLGDNSRTPHLVIM